MKKNVVFPNRPVRPLLVQAQLALGMTHRMFGEALGSSERTSLRWIGGGSAPTVPQLRELAGLVYPVDPALAATIAEAVSETLESLGIVPPAPPPPPPPAPRAVLANHLIADLIVCPAADALGAAPEAARAVVLAAFSRASELGLSVAQVLGALAASRPPASATAALPLPTAPESRSTGSP